MADRSVKVVLTAVIDDFKRQMGDAAKSTEQVGSSAKKSERESSRLADAGKAIGKSLGAAAVIATGAVASLGAAALKTGLQYNTLEQTSRAAFTTILGSADAAAQMMDQLGEFAKTQPFPREAFINATRQMLGFGFAAEDVVPTLGIIADAVAAIGGGEAEIALLADVFSKVQSTGRVMADDLNRLSLVGINAWEILAESAGVSIDQIRVQVRQGAVDSETAIAALTSGMEARFAGAAENIRQTWVGATDRIRGAFRDIGGIIAAPFIDPQGGGAAVEWANALADAMRALEGVLGPVAEQLAQRAGPAFDAVTRTLERAAAALRTADVSQFTGQLRTFAPAVAGLGAAGAVAAAGALPLFGGLAKALVPGGPLTAGIAAFVLSSPQMRDLLLQLVDAVAPLIPLLLELASDIMPALIATVDALATTLQPVVGLIGATVDSTVWWGEKLKELGLIVDNAAEDVNWWERSVASLLGWTDEAESSTGKFGRSVANSTKEVVEAVDPTISLSGAVQDVGDEALAADEALQGYLDTIKLATDPVYVLDAALRAVEEAEIAFNEAVAAHGPTSKEAEDAAFKHAAALDALETAALNGELSFEDFQARLKDWVRQGKITQGEADVLRDRVARLRGEAEDYKGNYNARFTETGIETVRQKIKNLESAILKLPSGKTIRISATTALGNSGAGVFEAEGGYIRGPGTATSDSIPAWLSDGEYVVKAASVARYGTHMMDMINAGRFAQGGPAGSVKVIGDATDWRDSQIPDAIRALIGQASGQVASAAAPGKVLPAGTYRIGRGPAAHGYNARDLPVPTGTPVYAGVAGPVTRAAYMTTSYGIHTKVDGVLYAHLSRLFVRLGQQVLKGQRIGLSGSTGNSTGPHLHIEPDDRRLYDQGGILPPGGLAFNGTSRPEAVLSPRDSASLQQLVGSLRSGSGQGGEFTGNLYLDSGEFMGVIKGTISNHDRDLRRRARAGTGLAR